MSELYFGKPWLPEQRIHRRRPTPAGEPCAFCGASILAGERGTWIVVTKPGGCTREPTHCECVPLGIVGHTYGVCSCTNYAGQPNQRAAALELWRRMAEKGAR